MSSTTPSPAPVTEVIQTNHSSIPKEIRGLDPDDHRWQILHRAPVIVKLMSTWYLRNGYIEYHRISWNVIEYGWLNEIVGFMSAAWSLQSLLLPAIELPLRAAWDRAHSCCESWRFGPSRATSLVQCCTTKCSMMQQRLEWKHMLHPKVMQICNCRHSLAGVAFHSKAIHRYSDSTRTRSKTMENWKRPSNVVVLQHMKLGRADRWVPSSPRESNL